LEVQDRNRRAVLGVDDDEPSARSAGSEVRGPDDPLGGLEVGRDLAPAPDVVAERDRVGPGREQPVGQARRDARPVGDVLAVDDAEADAVLLLQRGQALLDRLPACGAEDVGDEENDQGNEL